MSGISKFKDSFCKHVYLRNVLLWYYLRIFALETIRPAPTLYLTKVYTCKTGVFAAIGRKKMEGRNDDEEGGSSAIFSELKHYCIELLELRLNPKKNSSTLSHLLQLLRLSSPVSLQPFFEYVPFYLINFFPPAISILNFCYLS